MKSAHIHAAILFAVVVLAGLHSIGVAYAEYPPPHQQLRDEVPLDAIQCNAPRDLYIRDSQIPLCMTASTYELLLGYGMELEPPALLGLIESITNAGDSEVQQVVEATIRMYELDKENAFANINALSDTIVPHYPFVLDPVSGTIVSHGALPERIGAQSVILGDFAVTPPEATLDQLQDGAGTWAEYVFVELGSNTDQLKRSWLVLHDGYVFGAGYYYPVYKKIVRVVDSTIALYEEDKENAFASISALAENIDSHYPFVIDPYIDPDAGRVVAHGGFPDVWVGNPTPPLAMGWKNLADTMIENDQVAWMLLLFANPVSGLDEQKHILLKMHDGYLFCSGYYYQAESKVKNVVQSAIALYESDKNSAFDTITARSENIDLHYPFVINPVDKNIVAHGAFPEKVNTQAVILSGYADRPVEEILSDLQDGDGAWVEYVYRVPGTDFEERKRSFLQMHDGYIFGSGYYYSLFFLFEPSESIELAPR